MVRKKATVKKTRAKPRAKPEPADLRAYVAEAQFVDLMTRTEGWAIIRDDLEQYKTTIGEKLAYLNSKTPEYDDARILYIASDKLLKMVEDYAENKKRAVEYLKRIDNPQDNIIADVDN